MAYPGLETRSVEAIEKWLEREIRRMSRLILEAKAQRRRSALDRAILGIYLGEKFGYQTILLQIKKAGKK